MPAGSGAAGFSVGGEILLEAAAKSTALKAVVSEGAGIRVGEGIEEEGGGDGTARCSVVPRGRPADS